MITGSRKYPSASTTFTPTIESRPQKQATSLFSNCSPNGKIVRICETRCQVTFQLSSARITYSKLDGLVADSSTGAAGYQIPDTACENSVLQQLVDKADVDLGRLDSAISD